MSTVNKFLYTIFLSFISNFCFSQKIDLGSWNILNVRYKINEKWSVFSEAQIRSLKFYKEFHYHEYKAGVSFQAYKNVNLTLGAGDYVTYKEGGNFLSPKNNDEFRLWPQISFTQPIRNFTLEHRYRAEFRFTSNGFKNRFRYRLGVTFPLGNSYSYFNKYQVSVSNEIFFTYKEPYFERNRIMASVKYRMTKQFGFQLGYLHQFDYKINDETGRDFLQLGFNYEIVNKKLIKYKIPISKTFSL
ncbi:MAG: DUF2490 domain-containing protein [Ferruginibacter sp.]